MEEFNLASFCRGMRDVDRDAREMALFDLQRALNAFSFQPGSSVLSTIVGQVLGCFTQHEPHREVRSIAVKLVPQLLLLCCEEDQNRLISHLCTTSTSQKARFGERGYSELCDSAAHALKLSCETISSKSQADAKSWQQLVPVARKLAGALSSSLEHAVKDVVRENVYDCVGALIYPFGRVFMCDVGAVVAEGALRDFHVSRQLRRRAVSYLSVSCPFLSTELFDAMLDTVINGLGGGKHCAAAVAPCLHLFEGLVKGCPSRVWACALDTVKLLVKELGSRLNGASAGADCFDEDDCEVCDLMMRVIHLMVCQYPRELATIQDTIFELALEAVRFNPNYCGSVGSADGWGPSGVGEECYAEEEADMSWTLRVWAARLLASLIEFSPFSTGLIYRLNCEALCPIRDRVREVQVAALNFVGVVVLHSRRAAVSTSLLLFLEGTLDPLLDALGSREENVAGVAARTLQNLFRLHCSVFSSEVNRVHSVVDGRVRACLDRGGRIFVELTALALCILEGTSCGQPVAKLLDTVYAAAETHPYGDMVELMISFVKVMVRASTLAGATYSQRCMELYVLLVLKANSDDGQATSAIEAAEHCARSFAQLLPGDYFKRCVERLVEVLAAKPVAIRLLGCLTCCLPGAQLQPQVIERLCSGITKYGRVEQRYVTSVVSNSIVNGVKLTASTLDSMLEFARLSSLNSGERLLTLATLGMLEKMCGGVYHLHDRIMDHLLPVVWELLSSLSKFPSSHGAQVVRSTIMFIQSLYQQLESVRRSVLLGQMLEHISGSASCEMSSQLLRGVALLHEGILDEVGSAMAGDEPLLCVCVGTIGMCAALPDMWQARLWQFLLSSNTSCRRSVALVAVGRAISNSQNRSLVKYVVDSTASPTSNTALLWDTIREAVHASSVNTKLSPFSDADFCREITGNIMENLPNDDSVSAAAVVLGSFAPLGLDCLMDVMVPYLSSDSELRKSVSIHVQRCVLSSIKDAAENPRLMDAVEKSLRCLCRQASLQVRCAALKLFATVASLQPHVLLKPYIRDVVFPCILDELMEDPSLVLTVHLGSCTHREDKGREMRKLAFKCISVLLHGNDSCEKQGILEHYGRQAELIRCLVHACGSEGGGETDVYINGEAMDLIVRLVRTSPSLPWDASQVAMLCEKLNAALRLGVGCNTQGAAERQVLVKHTLNCIMCLSECPPFSFFPGWKSLVLLAQQEPLLFEAVRAS